MPPSRTLFLAVALLYTRFMYAQGHVAPELSAGSGKPVKEANKSDSLANIYVPMDSWIYGALERLAAAGLIPSQITGLRPWTFGECRRQLREAEENVQKYDVAPEVNKMLGALRSEFEGLAAGASGITLHSVYTRNGIIAGPVLNDSFHFGQTLINDYGRPFGRGWNSYTGFTASAEAGRFFAYVNGEYQHAPGRDPYSLPVRQAISAMDGIPLQTAEPRSDTDRFRTLDTYAGVRLGGVEISVGKQSMWWGPGYDAPLSFSTNAEPTKNFKISTVQGLQLWPFKEVRAEFVTGKLGGHKYTWRPWFNAVKASFKLTENLEIGFTRWSIFGGVGHPLTVRSLIRNLTSTNSPLGSSGVGASDPGDRKGGFDFRYRLPGLRNWLTLYTDSYCDDDPSPLAAPRRAAINPGIYLTHVPGFPRLDLRVEAPSTTPLGLDQGGQYAYFNSQYRTGNTNYGSLVGSWVGRDGRALEAWSTFVVSARSKVIFGYRQLKGSANFLPGGSTQSDASSRISLQLTHDWRAEWLMQYEKRRVPVVGPRGSNLSASMQITWQPNIQIVGNRH